MEKTREQIKEILNKHSHLTPDDYVTIDIDRWDALADELADRLTSEDLTVKEAEKIVKALSDWSRKYPRSRIYHANRQSVMDGELIEIENMAKEFCDQLTTKIRGNE